MPCSQSDAGAEVTSRQRALLLLKCMVEAITSWTSRLKTPQAALECVTWSSPSPIVASTSFGVFSFLRFVFTAYGKRTEGPTMGEDIGRRSQGGVRERSRVWQHESMGQQDQSRFVSCLLHTNSGFYVEWLMDKFNFAVLLGGHHEKHWSLTWDD